MDSPKKVVILYESYVHFEAKIFTLKYSLETVNIHSVLKRTISIKKLRTHTYSISH